MKAKGTLNSILSAVVMVGVLAGTILGCRSQKPKQFEDFPALLSALQTFSKDHTKRAQPLPATVSLGELVRGGYISSNAVAAFDPMEVRIWLGVTENQPQAIMMCARLPDGDMNVVFADASVHMLSREAYAQHLKKTGQEDGFAKPDQPPPSESK
jgi:hypothetical protein